MAIRTAINKDEIDNSSPYTTYNQNTNQYVTARDSISTGANADTTTLPKTPTVTPKQPINNANLSNGKVFDTFGSQVLEEFKPVYTDYFSQARKELNPQDEVRKAQSDVWQGFQRSTEAGLRDLSRAGVNLYSGRALDTIKDISNERAKALAFGSQTARKQVQDKQFERLGLATAAGSDLAKNIFTGQLGAEEGEAERDFTKDITMLGFQNEKDLQKDQQNFLAAMQDDDQEFQGELFYSGQATDTYKFMRELGFNYDKLLFTGNQAELDRAANLAIENLKSSTSITTSRIDASSRETVAGIQSDALLQTSKWDNETKLAITALDNIVKEKQIWVDNKDVTLDYLLGIKKIESDEGLAFVDAETSRYVSDNELKWRLASVNASIQDSILKNTYANRQLDVQAWKPIVLSPGEVAYGSTTGDELFSNKVEMSSSEVFQQSMGQMLGNSSPSEILNAVETGFGLLVTFKDGAASLFTNDSGTPVTLEEAGLIQNSDNTYSYAVDYFSGLSGDAATDPNYYNNNMDDQTDYDQGGSGAGR